MLSLKNMLLVGIIGISVNAYAQQSFQVEILSKDNGLPVAFIYVNTYQGGNAPLATVMTSEDGKATVVVESFPVKLEAVGVGYQPQLLQLDTLPTSLVTLKISKTFASLNEVVVTGVLAPVKPLDAFANYKVITAQQMQAMGAVNVQDALSFQLNAVTSTDAVLGSQLRMQGMDGSKIKILMDGVPIGGREGGNIDLSQFNVYNIERIEIIQGPMSIMYGSDALGGVINLISKNTKKKIGLSGEAYYESVGKYNFNLTATKTFGKHSLSIGGGRNYFDGYGKLNADTGKYGYYRTHAFKPKEQYMGNLNYSYKHSEHFNLRIASDFVKEKVTNRGVAFITPFKGNALDDYYRNTRSINRLIANGKIGKSGNYQLINGYTYYHRTKNSFSKNLVTLDETLTTAEGSQDTTSFHGFSLRGLYTNKLFTNWKYTAGYDLNIESGNSQKIPGGYRQIGDYASFATVSIPFLKEKLETQLGIRASYNTVYETPFVPSFNLLYKPRKNIAIRGSYAKGFRAPSLKELYLDFIDVNHAILGNPDLKAEKGNHYQASVSWMVFEKKTSYAQLLVTGYHNHVRNQIALAARYPSTSNTDSARFFDYTNILELKNLIGTVELEGQYHNLHYKLGYSYAYTYPQQDQYKSFGAYEMTATLQYYWKWSKLNLAIFNKLTGARPFLVSNIDGSSSYIGKQPAYAMTDASLSRKFWNQNIQLIVGVKNIFDVIGFQQSGGVVTGAHSGNGSISFMPRSIFTSLRLNID